MFLPLTVILSNQSYIHCIANCNATFLQHMCRMTVTEDWCSYFTQFRLKYVNVTKSMFRRLWVFMTS